MATNTAFKAGCEGNIYKYLGKVRTEQDLATKTKYDAATKEYAQLNAYLRENAQALYNIFSQGMSAQEAQQTLNNLCCMFDPKNIVTNKGLRIGCELDAATIQKFFERAIANGNFGKTADGYIYNWTQSRDGQIIEHDVRQSVINGIVGHAIFTVNEMDISNDQKRNAAMQLEKLTHNPQLYNMPYESLYKAVYNMSFVNDGLDENGLAPSVYDRVNKTVKGAIGGVVNENGRVVSANNPATRANILTNFATNTMQQGRTQQSGRVYTPNDRR